MKKLIVLAVSFFVFLASGSGTWGDEFPHPTMEMVNFAPESYEGMTVVFDNARFKPDFRKWPSQFDDILHTFFVTSENGDYYKELHYGVGILESSDEINFYVTEAFAGELIFAQLDSGYHKANLTCVVERLMFENEYPGWMCRVIKIEELDNDGAVIGTYTETGQPLPDNPCEEGIKAERERWDAGNDNKIGLPEAINALQIASGIKSE